MEQTMMSRKIIISEPITDTLARDVIDQLLAISEFDASMSVVTTYQAEPIEMIINSGGGSATAGFAIISAMEMCETPIITYGLGIIASMALGIFASGDVRIATRLARFMYHSVAYGNEGHIQEHVDGIKEATILQDMYDDLFLDRTLLKKTTMQKILNRKKNFFFSGQQAVELGIADDLLEKPEPKIRAVSEEEYNQMLKDEDSIEIEESL